jgi:tetratricopeptide (TPR) repeat protein
MKYFSACLLIASCTLGIADVTLAQAPGSEAAAIRSQWEHANFELEGKAQLQGLEALAERCDTALESPVASAELLTWCGIVNSSYAGAKGGLGALSYAKRARKLFEQALSVDRHAVDGAALCSLGTLYAKVPGWPIGFGDDDKAESYLREALEIAPGDIDNNYFMADYLAEEGREEEARHYLELASQAPARPGREITDHGRQDEIRALQARIDH